MLIIQGSGQLQRKHKYKNKPKTTINQDKRIANTKGERRSRGMLYI